MKTYTFPFVPTLGNSRDSNGKSTNISILNFKLTYLGAQEEFECVLGCS